MPYDLNQISAELTATALDQAYYGNALYVALYIPGVGAEERALLQRYLNGVKSDTDHCALMALANKLKRL